MDTEHPPQDPAGDVVMAARVLAELAEKIPDGVELGCVILIPNHRKLLLSAASIDGGLRVAAALGLHPRDPVSIAGAVEQRWTARLGGVDVDLSAYYAAPAAVEATP